MLKKIYFSCQINLTIGERPNKKSIESLNKTLICHLIRFTFKALNWERNSNHVLFFTRLSRGVESQAYKIKTFLFCFVLCFLAAAKTLFKTNEKNV